MTNGLAWGFLFMLALILIVAGFQGSMGRVLAVVFVPGDLQVGDSSQNGGCPPGQIMWFGVCQPNPWGFNLNTGTPGTTVTV